jgi:hypothetical protein
VAGGPLSFVPEPAMPGYAGLSVRPAPGAEVRRSEALTRHLTRSCLKPGGHSEFGRTCPRGAASTG